MEPAKAFIPDSACYDLQSDIGSHRVDRDLAQASPSAMGPLPPRAFLSFDLEDVADILPERQQQIFDTKQFLHAFVIHMLLPFSIVAVAFKSGSTGIMNHQFVGSRTSFDDSWLAMGQLFVGTCFWVLVILTAYTWDAMIKSDLQFEILQATFFWVIRNVMVAVKQATRPEPWTDLKPSFFKRMEEVNSGWLPLPLPLILEEVARVDQTVMFDLLDPGDSISKWRALRLWPLEYDEARTTSRGVVRVSARLLLLQFLIDESPALTPSFLFTAKLTAARGFFALSLAIVPTFVRVVKGLPLAANTVTIFMRFVCILVYVMFTYNFTGSYVTACLLYYYRRYLWIQRLGDMWFRSKTSPMILPTNSNAGAFISFRRSIFCVGGRFSLRIQIFFSIFLFIQLLLVGLLFLQSFTDFQLAGGITTLVLVLYNLIILFGVLAAVIVFAIRTSSLTQTHISILSDIEMRFNRGSLLRTKEHALVFSSAIQCLHSDLYMFSVRLLGIDLGVNLLRILGALCSTGASLAVRQILNYKVI